jgi:hypothetical protein
LKPFSLKLVAVDRKGYKIEPQNEICDIVRRRWKLGHMVKDSDGLLQVQEEDPFTDEEDPRAVAPTIATQTASPVTIERRRRPLAVCDTSRLDVGVGDSD